MAAKGGDLNVEIISIERIKFGTWTVPRLISKTANKKFAGYLVESESMWGKDG